MKKLIKVLKSTFSLAGVARMQTQQYEGAGRRKQHECPGDRSVGDRIRPFSPVPGHGNCEEQPQFPDFGDTGKKTWAG